MWFFVTGALELHVIHDHVRIMDFLVETTTSEGFTHCFHISMLKEQALFFSEIFFSLYTI